MRPEDHFGVVEKIAVDRQRGIGGFRRYGLGENVPCRAAGRGPRIPLLQEEDVGHDFRSCAVVHCALRQPHRADQVRHRRDVLARPRIDLVHRPARGDEGGEASRPQALDRPRDEIVVQRKPQLAGRIVGPHSAVGEGRIPNREIEDVW